jgi:ABC-2 type transport system ATP-binding protein
MIEVKGLCKCFGARRVVDNVSLHVAKGEVLGFLGPNGAGKTTTMRMITGFLPPSAGSVKVAGHDAETEGSVVKDMIGYLPESAPLYSEMSVQGFLRFAAEARNLWGAERDKAVDRAIELCFLKPVRNQIIETLSKGYRHRSCLAQALIHDPPVLILDEPTDGLDPNQKHEVRQLIRRMGESKAIIISTHILEEVDAVCTKLAIIDSGRIIAEGTPAQLKARAESAGSLAVKAAGVAKNELFDILKDVEGVASAQVLGEEILLLPRRVNGVPAALASKVSEILAARKWTAVELRTEEGRLDEFFRSITISETARQKSGKEAVA